MVMKKVSYIILVLTLCTASLSGCSKGDDAPEEKNAVQGKTYECYTDMSTPAQTLFTLEQYVFTSSTKVDHRMRINYGNWSTDHFTYTIEGTRIEMRMIDGRNPYEGITTNISSDASTMTMRYNDDYKVKELQRYEVVFKLKQ